MARSRTQVKLERRARAGVDVERVAQLKQEMLEEIEAFRDETVGSAANEPTPNGRES